MDYTAEDEVIIKEKWDDLLLSCTKICKNDEDWNFIKRAFFLAKEAHQGVRRRPASRIPPASYCSSQDRHRGDRTGREIGRGGITARRRGGHGIHRGRHGTHLRAENRLDGRRADQDVGRVQRRNLGTGRIFPQGVADPLGRRGVILIKIADRLHNMRTLGRCR